MIKGLKVFSTLFFILILGLMVSAYQFTEPEKIDHVKIFIGLGKWLILPIVVFFAATKKFKAPGLYFAAGYYAVSGSWLFLGSLFGNSQSFSISTLLISGLGLILSCLFFYQLIIHSKKSQYIKSA